jgi:hypothetical protein
MITLKIIGVLFSVLGSAMSVLYAIKKAKELQEKIQNYNQIQNNLIFERKNVAEALTDRINGNFTSQEIFETVTAHFKVVADIEGSLKGEHFDAIESNHILRLILGLSLCCVIIGAIAIIGSTVFSVA